MRANLKKLFFWSSLGGLAVGATAALARTVRRSARPKLTYDILPVDSQRIILRTERFSVESEGHSYLVHDEYLLQPTSFKVWSIMPQSDAGDQVSTGGIPIYHVTVIRHFDVEEPKEPFQGRAKPEERFYGTVAVIDSDGGSLRNNLIARGATLAIHKCLVGGASNGVPTGEFHRSAAPILHYRFEYTPPLK